MDKPVTISDKLQARRYDPDKPHAGKHITMLIQSQKIGTLQNFITVTGIEKSGKGKFVGAMAAAGITNQEVFGMRVRPAESRLRVALFDTEQGDDDFHESIVTIKKFSSTTRFPDNLDAYCMREDEPEERLKMIETYLSQTPDCSIIILDGLLDLTYSMNDETGCSKLIQRIMYWTKVYNCFIISVLHRSKISGATLGHLGAFANRKAQSVLLVEKDKDTGQIILKPEYLRNSAGFESIAIQYDKHLHTWVQSDYDNTTDEVPENNTKKHKKRPLDFDIHHHRDIVSQIFNSQAVQSYKELIENISQLYGAGKNWAVDCVPHLLNESLIYKIGPGEYTNRQQLKIAVINQ